MVIENDHAPPESVKAVDVHPHPQVGQQEAEHLPVGVVEQARVPQIVVAAASRMEEAAVRAVELIESVEDVLGGVRVDHVEHDEDAGGVRPVHQVLQVLGGAVSGRGREKGSHLQGPKKLTSSRRMPLGGNR